MVHGMFKPTSSRFLVCIIINVILCVCSSEDKTKLSNATNSKGSMSTSDDIRITRIFTMLIDTIGAFLNMLLIIAFLADPLKVLRKGVWITILNLAIADLISCVANFLDVGLVSEFHVTDSTTFRIVRFFLTFGVSASIMLLATLTVETYVVTKYPIEGRIILTSKKTVTLCAMAWFLATPLGLSNIAYLFTDDFSTLMIVYIAQIAVLELTVIIQVTLKVLIITEIMKSRRNTQQRQQQQHNNRHKEIAKTIIILNVILIVTALPYFVSKQLEFVWKLRAVNGDELLRRFSNYYEPIAAINYLANPILYALRLPDYRRTLLVPFTKCKGKFLSFTRCLRWNDSTITARPEMSLQQSTTTKL